MKNEVLERIKNYAVNELKNAYTYCALADGDNDAMLNSDDKNGSDIKIHIDISKEEE